jgi:hypothetical protein
VELGSSVSEFISLLARQYLESNKCSKFVLFSSMSEFELLEKLKSVSFSIIDFISEFKLLKDDS